MSAFYTSRISYVASAEHTPTVSRNHIRMTHSVPVPNCNATPSNTVVVVTVVCIAVSGTVRVYSRLL